MRNLFLMLVLLPSISYGGDLGCVFNELRPNATFTENMVNFTNVDSACNTYIGGDCPTRTEIDAGGIECERTVKLKELEDEIITRIIVIFPSLNTAAKIKLLKNQYISWGPNKTPTPDMVDTVNIYTAYTDAKAVIDGYLTKGEVNAYDVINDPIWP